MHKSKDGAQVEAWCVSRRIVHKAGKSTKSRLGHKFCIFWSLFCSFGSKSVRNWLEVDHFVNVQAYIYS